MMLGGDQYLTPSPLPVDLPYPNSFQPNVEMLTVKTVVKCLQPNFSAGCLHWCGWLGTTLPCTSQLPEIGLRATCFARAAGRAVSAKLKWYPGINAVFS